MAVGLPALSKLPPGPLTMVHNPVPTKGVLPPKVSWVRPQVDAPV